MMFSRGKQIMHWSHSGSLVKRGSAEKYMLRILRKGKRRTADFKRSLKFEEDRLREEDLSRFVAELTDLLFGHRDGLSRTTSSD